LPTLEPREQRQLRRIERLTHPAASKISAQRHPSEHRQLAFDPAHELEILPAFVTPAARTAGLRSSSWSHATALEPGPSTVASFAWFIVETTD